jgi:hypothetical protein
VSYKKQKLEFTLDFFLVGSDWIIFSVFWYFHIMWLYVLSSVLWCPLQLSHKKNDVRVVFTSSYLRYLGLFAYGCVQHILRCYFLFFSSSCVLCRVVFSIYCTVFLVLFVFVLCAQCWQFLSIVHPSLPLRLLNISFSL